MFSHRENLKTRNSDNFFKGFQIITNFSRVNVKSLFQKNPIVAGEYRWTYIYPDVPKYSGNLPGLPYFDAQFFKVHYRLGQSMDPMSRKILEMTFQAIYDAGNLKKVAVHISEN